MSEVQDVGETTSKNALKKQLKAEEAAKKKSAKELEKQQKASTVEAPAKKLALNGEDAEELDPTQYYENRLRSISTLEVYLAQFVKSFTYYQ